jgi:hypothetical protein
MEPSPAAAGHEAVDDEASAVHEWRAAQLRRLAAAGELEVIRPVGVNG